VANSGNKGNVFDLGELRRLVDDLGEVPPEARAALLSELAADADGCDCPDCGAEVLSFPPVVLASEAELAGAVPTVPLVHDARRLATWTGTRKVTAERLLTIEDARAAVAELELPVPAGDLPIARGASELVPLHLLWVVAVNTGLLQIVGDTAVPGPFARSQEVTHRAMLEFWDGVVMDVLDRADEGLTGSDVVDDHLAELLATMYSVSEGIAQATLIKGILQSHEVACEASAQDIRRLTALLPGELGGALRLLAYCGLIERVEEGMPRLTPLGQWAVRQDLLREGHDAPTVEEVSVFAGLSAAELVEAMLAGEAAPSAVAVWLEHRSPDEAAGALIEVAASGTPGQRGAVGTVLEELGPEAEAPVREALAEPVLWRYAASWLHIRDLPAPPLSAADSTWVAVDTLASLLHITGGAEEMAGFDTLSPGEELERLVAEMPAVDHPDTIAVLDMLAGHHPDEAVAKAARKSAMRARSGAIA
jgi:hypothetical protein